METICFSDFPLYRDLPLYEVHQIGRAATGVVSLLSWSRGGSANYIHSCIQNLSSGAIEAALPLPVWISCSQVKVNTSVQAWMKWIEIFGSCQFSLGWPFHSTRTQGMREPPPVSLLSLSREGLVNGYVALELCKHGWEIFLAHSTAVSAKSIVVYTRETFVCVVCCT